MAKPDPIIKSVILKLLSRGVITQTEAARLCGSSRQLVKHWAREINLDAARESYLTKLWDKARAK